MSNSRRVRRRFTISIGTKIPRVAKSRKISKVATKLIMTTKDKQMRKTIYAHHIDNLDYISSIRYYHRLHVDITKRGAIDYAKELESFDSLIITGDKDNVTPLKPDRQLPRRLMLRCILFMAYGT